MTGKLFINGFDVYLSHQVFITEKGYKELVSFPSLKAVESNDWNEYEGIEVDLTSPTLDKKEISISFASKGDVESFISLLMSQTYNEFNFAEIGYIDQLRLVSQSELKIRNTFTLFTLKFASDNPLYNYTYVEPISIGLSTSRFKIDTLHLSEYGLLVLEGIEEELNKIAPLKKGLDININNTNGIVYKSRQILDKKELEINLLLKADKTTFRRNYKALLYNLIQANSRQLIDTKNNCTYPFYYQKSSVNRFHVLRSEIWCEFSLSIIITGPKTSTI